MDQIAHVTLLSETLAESGVIMVCYDTPDTAPARKNTRLLSSLPFSRDAVCLTITVLNTASLHALGPALHAQAGESDNT